MLHLIGGGFTTAYEPAAARLRSIDHVVPIGRKHPHDLPGVWHGQCYQDCLVHALLHQKSRGYFIDLAANDAIVLSNSRALERDYDWNGLCIEPNPVYHPALLEHRNCTVVGAAVSDSIRPSSFDFTTDESMHVGRSSTIAGYSTAVFGKMVQANIKKTGVRTTWLMTIGEIFARHGSPQKIDFLSLDVSRAFFLNPVDRLGWRSPLALPPP